MFFYFSALPYSVPCGGNKHKTFKVNKNGFNEPAKARENKTQKSVFFSRASPVLH